MVTLSSRSASALAIQIPRHKSRDAVTWPRGLMHLCNPIRAMQVSATTRFISSGIEHALRGEGRGPVWPRRRGAFSAGVNETQRCPGRPGPSTMIWPRTTGALASPGQPRGRWAITIDGMS